MPSPRPSIPDTGAAVASPVDPAAQRACADQVMDVVPVVMDAIRGAMRLHVGEQLSVPQFRCLAFVSRTPGASIGAVASFLGVTMPTASAMVDRLHRAGAVQAEPDAQDRRRQSLHITPSGRAQVQLIRRNARDDLTRTLAQHSAEDLRKMQDGLAALRQVFCP